MISKIRYTPCFFFVSLTCSILGVKAGLNTCAEDMAIMHGNNELVFASSNLMNSYFDNCFDNNYCPFMMNEELFLYARHPKTLLEISDPKPFVFFDGTFFFNPFESNELYGQYSEACAAAGGALTCVDIYLDMQGRAYALNNLDIDIKIDMVGYPMCLPASCDEENDLITLAETIVKERIKENPDVKSYLESNELTPSFIDEITFEEFCTACGLNECAFTVEAASCEIAPPTFIFDDDDAGPDPRPKGPNDDDAGPDPRPFSPYVQTRQNSP